MSLNYHHLSIDFNDENGDTPATYNAVVLKKEGDEVQHWATGDPQADWAAYLSYAQENEIKVLESSSLTNFVFDVPGWKFILDENGHEVLVKDEMDEPSLDGPDA
jgi:hypothetical protein